MQKIKTEKIIKSFVKKQDIYGLSDCKNIHWTIDLIEKYEGQIDWNVFSNNLSVPWNFQIVCQFKNVLNWQNLTKTLWGYVGFRKSSEFTTIKWINTFKEYIDWETISEHCWGISPEMVIVFKDKWQWEKLINNNGVQWSNSIYKIAKPYLNHIDGESIKNSYMMTVMPKNIN